MNPVQLPEQLLAPFCCDIPAMQTTLNASSEKHARLPGLEAHLRERIRGQNHVLPRIVSVLQRGELNLTKPERPKGSFLLLGPTGVGKTEVTLTFTDYLMGTGLLFRFDMSEYQTQERLPLLLGCSATERGTLAAAYEKSRTGTLLFDEIEKAHPRIFDIFLQILDAARVTVADGGTLDLSGYYIVFTSNIGSADLLNLQHSTPATLERHVLTRAQQSLRPEIYARITEKLVFHRLSYDYQLEIARLMLERELAFLTQQGYPLEADASVLPFLVRHGFHPKLGARPMRDAVEKFVGDAVATDLLTEGKGSGRLQVDESINCLVVK
jgi:ATP-dependent Clp protease ATP-binding subunit ClpA